MFYLILLLLICFFKLISGYDVEVGIVFIRLTEMIEIQFGEYLGISRKQKNLELQQYIYTMLRFRKDIYITVQTSQTFQPTLHRWNNAARVVFVWIIVFCSLMFQMNLNWCCPNLYIDSLFGCPIWKIGQTPETRPKCPTTNIHSIGQHWTCCKYHELH